MKSFPTRPHGDSLVGLSGSLLMMFYLVFLFLFLFYVIVKVWPHCQPDGSVVVTTSPNGPAVPPSGSDVNGLSALPSPPAQRCVEPAEITFFWGTTWVWWEVRLLLIVIMAGAMGGLVHALRSLYWYIGNRELKWSWQMMYLLLPFCGAALAAVFYMVIRGGFFVPQGQAGAANPFGFAAISALIGMFSQQAVLKLKEVAEIVLTKPKPGEDNKPQGSDPVVPPPEESSLAVASVTPATGLEAGRETVEIAGTGFAPGVKVKFDTEPAKVSDIQPGKITVLTPPHAAGAVDIVITNPDQSEIKLEGGFTYVG